MSKLQRRNAITDFVSERGYITFSELKMRFPDASDMTLRTDLKELGEQGKIIRVRGGAKAAIEKAKPDDSFFLRTTRNLEKRQQIAVKAVSFLKKQLALICGICSGASILIWSLCHGTFSAHHS